MNSSLRYAALGLSITGLVLGASAAELGRWKPEEKDIQRTDGDGATGVQLALFHPVQIFSEGYDVYGFRLDLIYGKNRDLIGLDLGAINRCTGEVGGLQAGLANWSGSLVGIGLGGVNWVEGELTGLVVGVANVNRTQGNAVMLGGANVGGEEYGGLQVGVFNMAESYYGLQLGVVNYCEHMQGIQIGLANFIRQSPFLVFAPILNGYF